MPSNRRYAIIEAPSILGLKPTGVDRLAHRLLQYGLADRLQARHAGRVEPPAYESERDPATLTLNARTIPAYSSLLANAVEDVLERGEFPIVLGGDCSILLGPALALKRRGRFGLLFIDGHADFYQPEANPNGEAASMELAFVIGYGPPSLVNLENRGPLFQVEDVAAFGFRDEDEQESYGSQPLPREMLAMNLATVRRAGVAAAAAQAIEHLSRSTLNGFFLHLDADCLRDDLMPAVDYRIADGLTHDELTVLLREALSTGRCLGAEVTIYNPSLDDENGTAGRALTEMLVAAFGIGP